MVKVHECKLKRRQRDLSSVGRLEAEAQLDRCIPVDVDLPELAVAAIPIVCSRRRVATQCAHDEVDFDVVQHGHARVANELSTTIGTETAQIVVLWPAIDACPCELYRYSVLDAKRRWRGRWR